VTRAQWPGQGLDDDVTNQTRAPCAPQGIESPRADVLPCFRRPKGSGCQEPPPFGLIGAYLLTALGAEATSPGQRRNHLGTISPTRWPSGVTKRGLWEHGSFAGELATSPTSAWLSRSLRPTAYASGDRAMSARGLFASGVALDGCPPLRLQPWGGLQLFQWTAAGLQF